MNKDKQPIVFDPAYKIRDNQFWYNDCKFRHLIEDKSTICIKIEDFNEHEHTLTHSKKGTDGRTTLSYTLPHDMQNWWEVHRGELVKVELLNIGN
jgi:hypothetical protein